MDKFTCRDATGAVDVLASAEKYALALSEWVAENEIGSDMIEAAVEAVFDRFGGNRLPMPALLSMAVMELGATPEQHKALTTRVHAYVKGQTETGRLEVGKGPKGGVARLALPGEPIPAKAEKPAKK
jgi:hypothetical protein